MISSEELPLAMFLTTFREEVAASINPEASKILTEELQNLFKVVCSDRQLAWITDTHIKSIVAQRNATNPVEALLFAAELKDSLDIDQFFKFKVDPGKSLKENDIFRMRAKFGERELLAQLSS